MNNIMETEQNEQRRKNSTAKKHIEPETCFKRSKIHKLKLARTKQQKFSV